MNDRAMHQRLITGKPCFLVGIGGSGMLPLATLLAARGHPVAGSDRALDQGRGGPRFDGLRAQRAELFPQDGSGVTSAEQLVIASAAVEETVPDIVAANRLGCARATRAQVLAELFNAAPLSIGIAGTSGKSTVTGMTGWVLHAAGLEPAVMNGAVMRNFADASALAGTGGLFVSEVDESDGSIAGYNASVAVLTGVSLDHKGLDELRELFGGYLARAGRAVVNADDAEAAELMAGVPTAGLPVDTYSTRGARATYAAQNIRERRVGVDFVLRVAGGAVPVRLAVPGRHNVSNALAAIAAAAAAGVAPDRAAELLAGYRGLARRMELVGTAGGVEVWDDFAHNPDKVAAALAAFRAFPGRLLILFQPHGYGPLKVMGAALAQAFANGMAAGDVLAMTDPAYFGGTTSREVGSDALVRMVADAGADARHLPDREEAARLLAGQARPGDRIVVMGARDDGLSLLATRIVETLDGASA